MKALTLLALVLVFASCTKEPDTCTCDLVTSIETPTGWEEQSRSTITQESLCDQEGNETIVTSMGITAKSVYTNCKVGTTNTTTEPIKVL